MKAKNLTLLFILVLTGIIATGQNTVPKKPLFEMFTSSTCGPCAAQNPYLDAVLENNPGDYALIKYQMNWPGNGDPYYIADGGIRKNYYEVSGVPSLWINGENYGSIASINQEDFDSYSDETTALEIAVNAAIDENNLLTINSTLTALATYDSGLKAHILVAEKVTTENTGSNGEVEFYNVLLAMNPDGNGTALEAFTENGEQTLSASIDMTGTYMEQGNDLCVVVFVQNDDNKQLIQSEMVDVSHPFTDYTVNFNISDNEENLVEGAEIFLQSYGTHHTDAAGNYSYSGVLPGTYSYEISKAGLYPTSGTIEVTDGDVTEAITLEIPAYYFYEDFETEIPASWTLHVASPDYLYHYDGRAIFFKQSAGTNPIMLVSPEIDLSLVETLSFKTGEANGTGSLQVGTLSDPNAAETFSEIASFTPAANWEEHSIQIQELELNGNYLAFNLSGGAMDYFSFDEVKLTEFIPDPTYTVNFNIINVNEEAIEGATVIFNGVSQVTDSEGKTNFSELLEGSYNYTIEDENATMLEESITINKDTTITKTLSYVGVHSSMQNKIQVFPNPANDYILIQTKISDTYNIYHINGKLLQSGILSETNNKINTRHLSSGVYLIKLNNPKGSKTLKFSIAR